MEDGGGSMLVLLVVLVDMVEDLGRGKAVLLASAGRGMVRLTEIVGLEMGFLTSLGSGLGWSGGKAWCVGLLSVSSMTEVSENTLDEHEVVRGPDTLFCVGAPGFILANTAESSWPLIALFKAAAFLVSTAGAAAAAAACFIVEALSVFAPR